MAKNKADRLKGASFTKKTSQKEGTNVDEESSEEEGTTFIWKLSRIGFILIYYFISLFFCT